MEEERGALEAVSGTPVAERVSRVHWFAGRVHEVLDEVMGEAGRPVVATMSAEETAEALGELTSALARLDCLRMALLAHAEVVDVAAEAGATSTQAWLAHATRTPWSEARRLVRLAKRVHDPAGQVATGEALGRGRVRTDQAQVIVTAVDGLPASVDAEARGKAERHLLEQARLFDARRLAVLGRHLLAVIDPDAADAALAARLEAEEAAAARSTFLSLLDDGKGTCYGRFRIPSIHGAMLKTALEALVSPKRPGAIAREVADEDGTPLVRTTGELRGIAFTELLERYPADRLPEAGGGLATVLVTVDAARLSDDLAAATVDAGGHLSAGALRRLACTAGILPQVLGSRSEVLDQGRRARLFTAAQKIALRARDKTCTATGCTIPAAWCHAHHKNPWSRGGRTDLKDGRMLCPRHHVMIHHPRFTHTDLPDGTVRIARTQVRRL